MKMAEIVGRFVQEPEAVALIESYGLPYPRHGLAHDQQEAARIAAEVGYPVVLKVVSPDIIHKSEAGGVVSGLASGPEVRQAYEDLLSRVGEISGKPRVEGVLVCRQAEEGQEVIVGGLKDDVFGPSLMFGLGGIFTEVMDDVSFRVAPLEKIDALEMISEIKGYPLLTGVRGQAGCDLDRLVELLLAVSRMMTDRPEILELDLNPVRVYRQGLEVLDVRLVVNQA
ncbi:MAG: acetate--CoA ligase family protein [Deltaproteobacteria bacterium]|nr:acetate--CoA ligase family protein [Deltaproteobacteria bacterium]